jgi:hypothetical protein
MKAVVRCKECGHTWILKFNKFTGVPSAERVYSKLQAMCIRECPVCGRRLEYPSLVDVLVGREIDELEGDSRDADQTHITVKIPAWMKAKLEEIAGPGEVSELVREAISKLLSNTSGEQREGGDTLVTLAVKVPAHMRHEVDSMARRMGESISTVVRRAIEELLKEKEMG